MKRAGILVLFAVLLLTASGAFAADAPRTGDGLKCKDLPFVYNVYPTTKYGPAAADVVTAASNMLPCAGPAYALCYYSGPAPMTCKVNPGQKTANCECIGYQSTTETYKYFVDINGILNTCVYIETVAKCGHKGENCRAENSAPVCNYINQNPQLLMPKGTLISTFSPVKAKEHNFGCSECPSGLYAGCMTAPCFQGKDGKVVCECPLYNGPYQVGQKNVTNCSLGNGLVWSASYRPEGCPKLPGSH